MKNYIYLIPLLIPIALFSQTNLVQNPSFEELYTCNYEVVSNSVENVIPGWYSLRGFPRYFNSECLDLETTPGNFYDDLPHEPFNGNGIMVLNTLSPFNDDTGTSIRSYLQTRLKEPLVKDRLYYLEYYITQTNQVEYTHSHHAVHFIHELQTSPSTPLNNAPAIFLDPLLVVDTVTIKEAGEWVRHFHCFTVDTTLEVMTVGNFTNRDQITISETAGYTVNAVRTSYDHFLLAEVEPEITLDDYQDEICAGDCITISTNHSLIQGSFEWNLPGAVEESSTDSVVTICYDQAGVYDISLIVDHCSGHYENDFPNAITVREGINYTPPLDTTVCLGDEITINIPNQYPVLWDDGDDSQIKVLTDARSYHFELSKGVCKKEYSFDLSYILEPVNKEVELFACQDVPVDFEGQTYTSPGIYHDTLSSMQGCDSVYNMVIFDFYRELEIQIAGNFNFCPGEQATVEIISDHPFILWNDGSEENAKTFEEEGVFTLSATDENQCTTDTIIEISASPDVAVNANDIIDLDFEKNIPLDVNYTGDIMQYEWNGNASALSCYDCPFPTLEFPLPGSYEIEVVNQFGCHDRDQLRISLDKLSLYIPTAISKSSANFQNQLLYAQSKKDVNYALEVYDRWGELIFSADNLTTNDTTQGWDPKDYNSGVFVYTVKFLDEDERPTLLKGDVTVLD